MPFLCFFLKVKLLFTCWLPSMFHHWRQGKGNDLARSPGSKAARLFNREWFFSSMEAFALPAACSSSQLLFNKSFFFASDFLSLPTWAKGSAASTSSRRIIHHLKEDTCRWAIPVFGDSWQVLLLFLFFLNGCATDTSAAAAAAS